MLYYRRKIILALLEVFEGQLSAKSLQKYLFLFSRSQSEKAFDFVPFRYGCFSFQANQDILTMAKYGYIEIKEEPNGRHIEIKQSANYLNLLNLHDRQAMLDLKREFGAMSQTELIRYTYQNYPYYAIKSAISDELLTADELTKVELQKRTYTEKGLFSIGYEGVSLETYINKLIINDVHTLCDVRKNAYSQKFGFSKSQMQKACEGVGIKYIHIPELGIESEHRRELHSQADYDLLFEQYEATTLKKNDEALLRLHKLLENDGRIALTCFEKDPAQCHRSRIIKQLQLLYDVNYPFKLL